jgi:hypothetical protein
MGRPNISQDALVQQLISMRAQIDAILTIIHDEDDEENTSGECNHEKRLSLTTLGGATHWVCKDCGYEYREDDK